MQVIIWSILSAGTLWMLMVLGSVVPDEKDKMPKWVTRSGIFLATIFAIIFFGGGIYLFFKA